MKTITPRLKKYVLGLVFFTTVFLCSGIAAQALVIPAERIKAAVTDYVEKNSHRQAGTIRVIFISSITDEEIPAPDIRLEVAGRDNEDFINFSTFTVGFYSGGTLLKKRSVSVSMEVLTGVVTSKRALPRGRIIGPDDIGVEKRWMKTVPPNLAGLNDALGKSLTMSVGAGREMTKNMLSEPMLVKRGKVVRILFDNDVLKIASLGKSEEEGRREQVIRVKNISSNRIIYARVTGYDTVRVDF